MEPFRIFIGWDHRESVAWHVLAHSILKHATRPVSLIPLVKAHLSMYTRPRGPLESTDFSLTRFLVPYLCRYRGPALFMDCDMLVRTDLTVLQDLAAGRDGPHGESPGPGVWVCPHDYTPSSAVKFLKQPQTVYPRKNWSSFMLFNTERCLTLTPTYVNLADGLELHRFRWIEEERIAFLPLEWNWLVGEYPQNPKAKVLHYTLGGPWFLESNQGEDAPEWWEAYHEMRSSG